jgi:hypothetical protein
MPDKLLTLHPKGESGVNIDRIERATKGSPQRLRLVE